MVRNERSLLRANARNAILKVMNHMVSLDRRLAAGCLELIGNHPAVFEHDLPVCVIRDVVLVSDQNDQYLIGIQALKQSMISLLVAESRLPVSRRLISR
jgi:hypothetical protein